MAPRLRTNLTFLLQITGDRVLQKRHQQRLESQPCTSPATDSPWSPPSQKFPPR